MFQLNEVQIDLLKEIFNLGLGRAANSLSQLTEGQTEVELNIPDLRLITLGELADQYHKLVGPLVGGVIQEISGAVSGRAFVLYSHAECLQFVGLMLGSVLPTEELSDLESDALIEMGNLMLNNCLGALANALHIEIETAIPRFVSGTPESVLLTGGRREQMVIFLKSGFKVEHENLSGYLTLLIESRDFEPFLVELEKHFQRMMEGI